ncbi:hypothetical protein, partial [Deinococcus ficus]|uniref:hypothetical protein n=1 Tax=Deinococcus ficus TaxID=317577 RepID=UPI001E3E0959
VQDLLFCVPFAFHAPPSVLLDLQSDWHRKQGQGHQPAQPNESPLLMSGVFSLFLLMKQRERKAVQ